ncbi:hypothetical protein [Parvibium lacunae]|nr:hypothetical protein [Parvibium lacunae]
MWLILLEAFIALLLLVAIVWWTMFHGRGDSPADRAIDSNPSKHDDNIH